MKNILYIHGFNSSKESYCGNTLQQLFPQFEWTLETFDLLNVEATNQRVCQLLKEKQIDTVVSSSLGCMYNLFIKKMDGRIVNKILINPCCFPSRELPKLAAIPPRALENCRAMEFNIYESHADNNADNLFGIFARGDELLHYHDFFVGRYGNAADEGQSVCSNCLWVEGGHSHLAKEVLNDAMQAAIHYFEQVEARRAAVRENAGERPVLYFDMDNTLVDFQSGIDRLTYLEKMMYDGAYDEVPGIFSRMEPMPGAVEAVCQLAKKYDVFILSTAPWRNETALNDKLAWLKRYFGEGKESPFYKRVIFSHRKDLNKGAILIDDRPTRNGCDRFEGRVVAIGSAEFPNWDAVLAELL